MNRAWIERRIRSEARDRPGVYRWLAPGGDVLYVGKSVRVRARLLSHLRDKTGKSALFVREAADVRWEYAHAEYSALVREFRLIRAYRPPYNVEHRNSRRLCFVKLTKGTRPRLLATRKVGRNPGIYVGPFRNTKPLRRAVSELARAVGLPERFRRGQRRFSGQGDLFDSKSEEANKRIRGAADSCAEGAGDIQERAAAARSFLEMHSDEPIGRALRARALALEAGEFERAARLGDRARILGRLRGWIKDAREWTSRLDLVYAARGADEEERVLLIRGGRLESDLPAPSRRRAEDALARLIRRTYAANPKDAASLAPTSFSDAGTAAEALLAAGWFVRNRDERARAVPPDSWLGQRGYRPLSG